MRGVENKVMYSFDSKLVVSQFRVLRGIYSCPVRKVEAGSPSLFTKLARVNGCQP